MNLEPSALLEALHAGPDGEGCASAERVWQAARGLAAPEETQALLDHAAFCATCALSWNFAHELAAEAGELLSSQPAAVPPPGRTRRWMAFAIAAAVAAAAAPLLLRAPSRKEAELRGEAESTRLHSLSGATLPRSRCLLRWTSAGAGARYDVSVATKDLRALHSARGLGTPEALVPEAALAGVPARTELVFMVTASLPDGTRMRSGALLVRVE